MPDERHRIALVTPWFGSTLTGGAERLAWQVAHGLAARGHHVEVFTTCARSFASNWDAVYYRPGAQDEGGVLVRRFPVDVRSADAFDRANEILIGRPLSFYRNRIAPIEPDVANDFVRGGINSAAATDALRERRDAYDAVLIMPYPYGFALAAVEAAGRRAMLQPCLHDEPYAFLPAVESAFRRAGALLFNSAAERRLAATLFGPSVILKSTIVGHWVDEEPSSLRLPRAVRGFRPSERRYVLYLGRRDATKNVELLAETFARFRRHCPMLTLELVLVGPGTRSFEDARHGVRDLGLVDEAQKAALLAHALAVVQPSVNESFSRTVTEGWRAGKPVLVNGRCPVTAEAVRDSGGGWTATTKAEWSAHFELIDRMTPAARDALGERGRAFVAEQTSRERILDRYEAAISALLPGRAPTHFDIPPSPEVVRRLSDGRRTILFAGPLDRASCIEQLLAGFAFLLALGIDARLVLAGAFDPRDDFADAFYALVARARLTERVVVCGPEPQDLVTALYRSADLYWSAADEGPAAEIVDALGFGVPVLAYANRTSRRVLGNCGVLFNDKRDPRTLAGIALLLLTDRSLRETVLEGQRRRFETFRHDEELERAG